MSKLIEHADAEYQIIREYLDAIEEAHKYQPKGPLRTFSEEIRNDLKRNLELHMDKNSLKKKYYRQRAVILDSEAQQDRAQLVQEMRQDKIENNEGEENEGIN